MYIDPENDKHDELWMRLNKQKNMAADLDTNPYTFGYEGELLTRFPGHFPETDRLSPLIFYLTGHGWLKAESLYALAEMAARGPDHINFLPPEKKALIPGLNPEAKASLWNSQNYHGLSKNPDNPTICPFWGPCLGGRYHLAPLLQDLASHISQDISPALSVEIAGCPLDCRRTAERADLCIILDENGQDFILWIGGKHQSFKEPILPFVWMEFKKNRQQSLIALVAKVHDIYLKFALPQESFPALAKRLGLARLERLCQAALA